MAEYVEKSKMKQYVKNFFIGLKVDGDKFDEEDCCETICQIIDFSPAADVAEVKHGKWKLVKNKVKCSCCQKDAFSVSQTCYKNDKKIIEKTFIHTPYCPHCGAKMDGGKKWQEN